MSTNTFNSIPHDNFSELFKQELEEKGYSVLDNSYHLTFPEKKSLIDQSKDIGARLLRVKPDLTAISQFGNAYNLEVKTNYGKYPNLCVEGLAFAVSYLKWQTLGENTFYVYKDFGFEDRLPLFTEYKVWHIADLFKVANFIISNNKDEFAESYIKRIYPFLPTKNINTAKSTGLLFPADKLKQIKCWKAELLGETL